MTVWKVSRMMLMFIMRNLKLFIITGGMAVAGCQPMKQAALPAAVTVPQTFTGVADTTGSNPIRWRDFFADETLQRLIDTALHNNFDVKAAVQRIELARANAHIAHAARLPFVSAGVSGGADRYGKYTLNGVGNFDTNLSPNIDKKRKIPTAPTQDYFAGFRSTWEADIWGKLKDRKKAAYARYLASEKGRQWLTTQIVAEVAARYYDLVALDNQLRTLQRNIGLQQRGLEVVEAQMAGGRATALAVKQFNAQVLHTQGAEYQIKQSIIRAENDLNNLLGRFPTPIARDTALMSKPMPENIHGGIPSQVLLRRPDIQEAELALQAAKADIAAARKEFLPSVNINAYVGLNAFKLPLLFNAGSLAAGAAASLAGPLVNRTAIRSGYHMANAAQLQAFYNYQKNIVQGFQEVATQLQLLDNFKQAYLLKVSEVQELTEGVSHADDLYLAGYANYLEVIVAQGSVLQAEMEQADIKKEMFQTLINLFRSTGGVWE